MDKSAKPCMLCHSLQLYDLMTMAFKYQVLLCPRPKDILLVSFNHMDAIRDFVKDTPSILSQVDETYQQLIEVWTMLYKNAIWTLRFPLYCEIFEFLEHVSSV